MSVSFKIARLAMLESSTARLKDARRELVDKQGQRDTGKERIKALNAALRENAEAINEWYANEEGQHHDAE